MAARRNNPNFSDMSKEILKRWAQQKNRTPSVYPNPSQRGGGGVERKKKPGEKGITKARDRNYFRRSRTTHPHPRESIRFKRGGLNQGLRRPRKCYTEDRLREVQNHSKTKKKPQKQGLKKRSKEEKMVVPLSEWGIEHNKIQ